jgi:hypothetical protein
MTTTISTPNRGTINAGEFAALCNLFHVLSCDKQDLTAGQVGDIVYHDAAMVVCDESRMLARALMAYLGLRFAEGQPRHAPGSRCRFADELGNCEFHDLRFANTLVGEVRAAMLNGKGSLTYADDES